MSQIDLCQLWPPKPTQQKFLEAIAQSQDMGVVAYVGALGSGKSWALCRATIGLCLQHPGIRVLVGRFHATDLRDTTQVEFFKLLTELENQFPREERGPSPTVGSYHKVENRYEFHNGSQILFRSLEDAETKYKSLEIACYGIDEASEVPREAVYTLNGRRRQKGMPHVGYIVTNPTGMDHWLYDWFVANPRTDHVVFRTNTLENIDNLPPNYIDSLRQTYPEDWVRRYIEGEWGYLSTGRPVFPTFSQKDHVASARFDPRRIVHVGIDPGYRCPGVLWVQLDRDDRLRVLKSWVPREMTADKLAQGILQRQGEWFPKGDFLYYAGHDVHSHRDTSVKTAYDIFAAHGIFPRVRFAHVERGLTIIRRLLDTKEGGMAGVVIDPCNQRLVEGLAGGYQYPKERPGRDSDAPVKNGMFDPLFDALRYIVIHLFTPAGQAPTTGRVAAFTLRPARRVSWPHRSISGLR